MDRVSDNWLDGQIRVEQKWMSESPSLQAFLELRERRDAERRKLDDDPISLVSVRSEVLTLRQMVVGGNRRNDKEWSQLRDDLIVLDGQVEELSKRVAELEARPYPTVVPVYPPNQPTYPWWPIVWSYTNTTDTVGCSTDAEEQR